MEIASLRDFLKEICPQVIEDGLEIEEKGTGAFVVSKEIEVGNVSLLHTALRKFSCKYPEAQIERKCKYYIAKVRLGDVTTKEEQGILAWATGIEYMWPHRVLNPIYQNPDNQIERPEWNSDFVVASDVRNGPGKIMKPRYEEANLDAIDQVAEFVASYWNERGIVVHTGAGISAAAGIRTFREGNSEGISIEVAMPTYAHYALVALAKVGKVDYIVSQNVDGLHRRSGMAADRLSELHGNTYIETCACCKPTMQFVRPYDVRKREARKCPKGKGPLYDSIINFGDGLPEEALRKGREHSKAAPLNLVLGSSLLVQPACHVPFKDQEIWTELGATNYAQYGLDSAPTAGSYLTTSQRMKMYESEISEQDLLDRNHIKEEKHTGPVVIVSKSCTGFDLKALETGGICLRADADEFMERLMHFAGIVEFRNSIEVLERLAERVHARDKAVLDNDADVPYDGGADGGVVPEALLKTGSEPSQIGGPIAMKGGYR